MADGPQPLARRAAGPRALLSGLPVLLYAGLLFAFSLPFISVSCGDSSSGILTGYDVLAGSGTVEPDVSANEDGSDARDVNGALSFQQFLAWLLVIVAVLTVSLSLLGLAFPRNRFLISSSVIASVFAIQAAATSLGAAVASFAPDVHHHRGYWIAVAVVFGGFFARIAYAAFMSAFQRRPGPVRPWLYFLAIVALALVPGPLWPVRAGVGVFAMIVGFPLSLVLVAIYNDPRDLAVLVVTGLPLAFVAGSFQN